MVRLLFVLLLCCVCSTTAFDASDYDCNLSASTRSQIAAWYRGEASLENMDMSCMAVNVAGGTGRVVGSIAGQIYGARVGQQWLGPFVTDTMQALGVSNEFSHRIGSMFGSMAGQYLGRKVGARVGEETGRQTAKVIVSVARLFGGIAGGGGARSKPEGRAKVIAECEALFEYDITNQPPSFKALKRRWRKIAILNHPDKPGGTQEKMLRVNFCREALQVHYNLHDPRGRRGQEL